MQNGIITILNKEYSIEFSKKLFLKEKVVKLLDKIVVFTTSEHQYSHHKILVKWLKKESKDFINKRVKILAERYSFNYNKVAIKDQSSIWGSCSSKKNLNFSWRLILAPLPILDYVILHELSHTRQMNHSKAFWDVVEGHMPQYKEFKEWLRLNGKYLKKMI